VADLVLFDPAKVADTATFEKPLSYSIGMEYVLINGQLAIDKGQSTGVLAGKVIRANR
jgi:N-acyl-D-amino-acid deacylase